MDVTLKQKDIPHSGCRILPETQKGTPSLHKHLGDSFFFGYKGMVHDMMNLFLKARQLIRIFYSEELQCLQESVRKKRPRITEGKTMDSPP